MNLLMSSYFDVMMIQAKLMIPTGLNLPVPPLHTTGIIHILTCQFIFRTSSGLSSPSTIKSEHEDDKWRIEYLRKINKLRTDHPEL